MATSGVAIVGKKPTPTARQPEVGLGGPAHLGLPANGVTVPLVSRFTENVGRKGLEKLGWLKRLKASRRNCIVTCSPSLVSLARPRSKLWKSGPRKALRGRFPK